MGSHYGHIFLFAITFVWISATSADDMKLCFRCDTFSPCLDTKLVCDSTPHCANGLDEETTEGGGCYETPDETSTLVIIYIVIGVIVCEAIAIFGVVWILLNCSCCACVCPEVHRKRREKQEARRKRNKSRSQPRTQGTRSVSNRWGRHLHRSRDATARAYPELPQFLRGKSRPVPISQIGKPYHVPESVLPTVVPKTVIDVDRSHGPLRGMGIPRPKNKLDEQQVFPSVMPISSSSFDCSSRNEFPVFSPEVSERAFDVGISYGQPRTPVQKPMTRLPSCHASGDMSTSTDSHQRSFEQDNVLGRHLQRDSAYGVDNPDTSEMFSWSEPDRMQTTIAAKERHNDQLERYGPRPIIHKTTVNNLTVVLPGANYDLAGKSSAAERCTLTEIIEHDQPGPSNGPSDSNSCRQVMPFYRPRKGTNMYDVNNLC